MSSRKNREKDDKLSANFNNNKRSNKTTSMLANLPSSKNATKKNQKGKKHGEKKNMKLTKNSRKPQRWILILRKKPQNK